MTMRTVTLELLRHGPAHNQLLSPLTPYLALCGNHDAETIQVHLEHLPFLRIRERLDYQYGTLQRITGLQDATREVSRLLESIRSLCAELASSEPEDGRRIHLRLVLSASELAMLPFELATAPPGMPGQGQHLCLQTTVPVTLTREVRRVPATTLKWPRKPQVLLIAAAPRCVSEVPFREHQDAIEEALAPYLKNLDREKELSRYLTVLPEATLDEIQAACANPMKQFTHVHILAHGMAHTTDSGEPGYGLALHQKDDKDLVDVVSGARLAQALRCHKRGATNDVLSSPVVVTVASCFGASQGNVMEPGASIAHALHESGIPLVVGSQFPLSTRGSTLLTQVLYRRLFAGDDPRSIVHDLRQTLYATCPEAHDWASVVTYASFPSNLEQELQEARFEQAQEALEVLMARVKAVVNKAHQQMQDRRRKAAAAASLAREFEALKQDLLAAMTRVEARAPRRTGGSKQVRTWGMLARARKQVAFLLCVATAENGLPRMEPKSPEELQKDEPFCEALRKARRFYFECYKHGTKEAWPLVQYLALTVGLHLHKDARTSKITKRFRRLWNEASSRARDNLLWGTPQQKMWAYSSLAELALLSILWTDSQRQGQCWKRAIRHIQRARHIRDIGMYDDASFDLQGQLRQFRRYQWWGWGDKSMQDLCEALVEEVDGE
ncbi:CHAT domain-containing protein [Myxococcus sp. AM001]|nr:CHAT domain-containing protein [Myxococcus sp. AM001]